MRRRYRDDQLQRAYAMYYEAGRDPASFLYVDGRERRGSSARCAFWNGVHGIRHMGARGSLDAVAHRAGKDCAKFIHDNIRPLPAARP